MPLILRQIVSWLLKPGQILAVVLCGLVVSSALGVAYSSHLTRNMYRDLQQLEKAHDDLEHEYEMLLLEQSAHADYTRLDQLAQDQLAMTAPTPADTVVIE